MKPLFIYLSLAFVSFSCLSFAMPSETFQKAFLLSKQGESLQAAKHLIYALPYETEEGIFIANEFVHWISSSSSSMTKHFNAASFYLLHQNKEKAKIILIQDFEETHLEVMPFIEHLLHWMEEAFSSQQETSSSLKTWLLQPASTHAEENEASIIPCERSIKASGSADQEGNKEAKLEFRYENDEGNLSAGASVSVSQDKDGNRKSKVELEFLKTF